MSKHLDVRLRSSELSWECRADGSRRVPLSFGVGIYDASGKLLQYAKGRLDVVQREVEDNGSSQVGSAERKLP